MTKENPTVSISETLTEQWKNGTLKEGWYYLSIVPSKKCIDYYYGKDFERYNEWAITKVLAPVPSCDQFVELVTKCIGLEKENAELLEKFKELVDQNESLKQWFPPIQIDPEEVAELVQKKIDEALR